MGLDAAIDRLYSAGWSERPTEAHEVTPEGRAYPTARAIEREFETRGRRVRVRHLKAFDCYRAEWTGVDGGAEGAVVGATEAEAGVYALARLLAAEREMVGV